MNVLTIPSVLTHTHTHTHTHRVKQYQTRVYNPWIF